MSTLSIRLPNSLHQNAKIFAQSEGISINQLMASALAEKLASLSTEEYINQRGNRATREKFLSALHTVPDVAERNGLE